MNCIDDYHTYWVTGASDGIGKAIVLLLAQHGKNVILSGKNESKLQALKDTCEKQSALYRSGKSIIKIVCFNCHDILKTQEVSIKLASSVDVAILCAGVSQRARVIDMEQKSDAYIYTVNFISPATTIKQLTRIWTGENNSTQKKILVISSVAGHIPVPSRAMYGASKKALEHYCETTSNELINIHSSSKTGSPIGIITIIPGFVNTTISQKAITGNFSAWDKQDNNQLQGISVEVAAQTIMRTLNSNKAFAKKYIGMNISLYIILWLYRIFPRIANKILSKIDVAT